MATILIAYRNHVDAADLSGGSWSPTLPVANLTDPQPSKVARTTDTAPESTTLSVDFGSIVAVRFIALVRHNLSQTARWRIRFGDDAVLTSAVYDSGLVGAWPPAVPFGVGLWGEFNWGGRFDASEAETYGAQAINTFDDVIRARYLRIDFDDPDNAAGFLQAGRLVAAPAWQPSVNFQYGWSLEQVDQSEVKRSRGGQAYVNARPRFRRLQFTIDHLEKDEMFGHAYELERLKGKGGDIMVIADPEDLTHTQRHAVYGALTESAPIFNMQPGRYRRRFIVEELL